MEISKNTKSVKFDLCKPDGSLLAKLNLTPGAFMDVQEGVEKGMHQISNIRESTKRSVDKEIDE